MTTTNQKIFQHHLHVQPRGKSYCSHQLRPGGRHLPPPPFLSSHGAVSKLGKTCRKRCTGSLLSPLDPDLWASCPHISHLAKKTGGVRNGKVMLALWLHLLPLTKSKLQLQIMNLIKAIHFCWSRSVISIFLFEFHSRLINRQLLQIFLKTKINQPTKQKKSRFYNGFTRREKLEIISSLM